MQIANQLFAEHVSLAVETMLNIDEIFFLEFHQLRN